MKAKLITGVLLLALFSQCASHVNAQSDDVYELVRGSLNSGQVSQGEQYLLIASFDSNSAAEMNSAEFVVGAEPFADTRQQIHLPLLLR